MEELGLGKCLVKINLIDIVKIFTFDWKWIEDIGKNFAVDKIVAEAKIMSQNLASYQTSLKSFIDIYPSPNGACEAADIIK